MSLLLDTHALLWWLGGEELDEAASQLIGDPGAFVAVSAASVWEAGIKESLGKLSLPGSLVDVIEEDGFQPLPITVQHADVAAQLPPHHRDPFDRMLVAQAQLEGLMIVSRDPAFDAYDVPVLRC